MINSTSLIMHTQPALNVTMLRPFYVRPDAHKIYIQRMFIQLFTFYVRTQNVHTWMKLLTTNMDVAEMFNNIQTRT